MEGGVGGSLGCVVLLARVKCSVGIGDFGLDRPRQPQIRCGSTSNALAGNFHLLGRFSGQIELC